MLTDMILYGLPPSHHPFELFSDCVASSQKRQHTQPDFAPQGPVSYYSCNADILFITKPIVTDDKRQKCTVKHITRYKKNPSDLGLLASIK